MSNQTIELLELTELLILLFLAAIALGVTLVITKIICVLINNILEKHKKNKLLNCEINEEKEEAHFVACEIDGRKEAARFVSALKNHKDISSLDVYTNNDEHWDYYYQITGFYKLNYFLAYAYKPKNKNISALIKSHVTPNDKELKQFFKTITNLKFELS
jgi:hypothetical protein